MHNKLSYYLWWVIDIGWLLIRLLLMTLIIGVFMNWEVGTFEERQMHNECEEVKLWLTV